ncbi:MAG TPA: glycoside hydrolase family 2 TIM barrel-domain containing protein [Vitreimonas sp.]|nr:glycoside hydrolase family 2 TIM barrel-domain containing protein [Vitreimonas sp.]
MRRSISLDGAWERRDFLDEAWRWSDALRGSAAGPTSADGPPVQSGVSAGWRAGRVPGSTIDDAWRAGEIPNPYVDRNSLAAEWVPQRAWLYRRRFTVPDDAGSRAALRFDGLDPGGTVLLDGQELARHDGMFVPLEIELGDRLTSGSTHELVVALDPAPPMPSQVSRTELARHHRSRMGYGWDFCPRMVQTGIWRSVTLELRGDAWLGRPDVDVHVDPAGRRGTVHVACPVGGVADGMRLAVRVVDLADGRAVAAETARVSAGAASALLDVRAPRRWWPNGAAGGTPALHRLELSLEHGTETLDRRSVRIGFRSCELTPTTRGPTDARPYTLTVNGRPTWIRGWNWTPIDACYGVPRPEQLRHLVELLRRANVNLVRVWGGGLIESDAFYDACDEAGIMVWQEFAQSSSGVSNTPASDEAFVELMAREARDIIPTRTHHPSLAIWCGGNELADADGRPLSEAHPVIAALHDEVRGSDPGRNWLPTSPSGPRFDNSLAAIADDPASLHDVHGPWEHQGLAAQHELANATTSLLHSEFGVEGMTNLATLRATVTDPDRWAADRSDPVLAHRGAWWNNKGFVERAFGGGLSLEELERASQHLQADGLRTLIEGDRRRWPRNAGSLPWVFNEPFPNAWSNAAVDYFGRPKAAYSAVAEAYAPVLPGVSLAGRALEGAAELVVRPWLVNDTDAPISGPLTVSLHDATGRCLDEREIGLHAGANAVATADPLTFAVPSDAADLLVVGAAVGERAIRRLLSRTDSLEPLRRLPAAGLAASVAGDEDAWTVSVRNDGPVAAPEVRLEDARPVGWPEREPVGAPYLDANLVTLLPGEERRIAVSWREVLPADRCLRLSGWNVAARELRHG